MIIAEKIFPGDLLVVLHSPIQANRTPFHAVARHPGVKTVHILPLSDI